MTIETINITTLAIFLNLLNGPHCRYALQTVRC